MCVRVCVCVCVCVFTVTASRVSPELTRHKVNKFGSSISTPHMWLSINTNTHTHTHTHTHTNSDNKDICTHTLTQAAGCWKTHREEIEQATCLPRHDCTRSLTHTPTQTQQHTHTHTHTRTHTHKHKTTHPNTNALLSALQLKKHKSIRLKSQHT